MSRDTSLIVSGLEKSFGAVRAVRGVSFTARPGRVTGFLGPNGSGKTTTLRMLLGLIAPDAGTATIGGTRYDRLDRPALTVGSALEASFHPAHTGAMHLRIAAAASGIPAARAAEVLALVGLAEAGPRRIGGYSLGMRQRLALATALLGDPEVLVLDEPINGLDPEGIRWIRGFLRSLAAGGTTVLLSSHLLAEVQQTVDDVVVIREGAVVYAGELAALEARAGGAVIVDSADRPALLALIAGLGLPAAEGGGAGLRVCGIGVDDLAAAAFHAGIILRHLSVESEGLEEVFFDLTGGVGPELSGRRAGEVR